MKKLGQTLLVISFLAVSFLASARPAYAALCAEGEPIGNCECNGQIFADKCTNNHAATPAGGGESVFGKVDAPPGVAQYNGAAGANGIGLIPFLSTIIRIATIVAGIIVFINFILAGYTFLTSEGNAKATEEVKNSLTYSVVGLLLIVASYTIIAIISLIFFGRADFILNPTITGPQ